MSNNNNNNSNNQSKAGRFYSSVYINGKAYNCTTVRDQNGNIIYKSISPKFLGIF